MANEYKNDRYSYFYYGKSNYVHRFSVIPLNIRENTVKMNISADFRIKSREKWSVKKTYQPKLEFYNADRKMKNII